MSHSLSLSVFLCLCLRSGSTVTACVWRLRWSITFVNSVTLAQWTEYVTYLNFFLLLIGKSFHVDLPVCFF